MKKRTAIVTGCAGFIGSNLVDRLLAEGWRVTGVDNFSTGQREFLEKAFQNPSFRLAECDLLDLPAITKEFANGKIVFHLAANADLRFGIENPRKDLEQNTIVTYQLYTIVMEISLNLYNYIWAVIASAHALIKRWMDLARNLRIKIGTFLKIQIDMPKIKIIYPRI